jgi:hypothetical protein
MRFRYAVTYEFPLRAPVTHRGTVGASQEATCFSRAVRTAKKALKPKGWSSVVCCLLERLPDVIDKPVANMERESMASPTSGYPSRR